MSLIGWNLLVLLLRLQGMFLLKLLQYVPNLENGKIYSLLGFYRADINGVIFSLSDYQLTEECSQ